MSLTRKYADIDLQEAILNLLDTSLDDALEQTGDFPSEEAKTIKRLAKIGLKSESFAREALDLAKIYEGLMPRALDLERFEKTIAQRDAIRARLRKAQLLVERLQVLSVLLGVDSYSDALDVYHHLKRHGRGEEMQAVVKHLGRIFKRGKKVEEPVEEGQRSTGVPPVEPMGETPILRRTDVPPVESTGETPMLQGAVLTLPLQTTADLPRTSPPSVSSIEHGTSTSNITP